MLLLRVTDKNSKFYGKYVMLIKLNKSAKTFNAKLIPSETHNYYNPNARIITLHKSKYKVIEKTKYTKGDIIKVKYKGKKVPAKILNFGYDTCGKIGIIYYVNLMGSRSLNKMVYVKKKAITKASRKDHDEYFNYYKKMQRRIQPRQQQYNEYAEEAVEYIIPSAEKIGGIKEKIKKRIPKKIRRRSRYKIAKKLSLYGRKIKYKQFNKKRRSYKN